MLCLPITAKCQKKNVIKERQVTKKTKAKIQTWVIYYTQILSFPFLLQLYLYLCLAVLALTSEISLCCFYDFNLAFMTVVIFGYTLSLSYGSLRS